jgi:hypothetical protein
MGKVGQEEDGCLWGRLGVDRPGLGGWLFEGVLENWEVGEDGGHEGGQFRALWRQR